MTLRAEELGVFGSAWGGNLHGFGIGTSHAIPIVIGANIANPYISIAVIVIEVRAGRIVAGTVLDAVLHLVLHSGGGAASTVTAAILVEVAHAESLPGHIACKLREQHWKKHPSIKVHHHSSRC